MPVKADTIFFSMRKFVLLLFMAVSVLALSAQEKKVSGRLVDSGTHESVGLATVQLLKRTVHICVGR